MNGFTNLKKVEEVALEADKEKKATPLLSVGRLIEFNQYNHFYSHTFISSRMLFMT